MSIEGPGLYQDDTGVDVRSEFRELIGAGHEAAEATEQLVARWSDVMTDEDVYCVFYLALADTQWRLGRPVAATVETALSIIDTGRDLRRWDYSPPFQRRRTAVLKQLRDRLASTAPEPRAVRKSTNFATDFAVGDVVRYTTEAGGEFLLGVAGVAESNEQRFAIVRVVEPLTKDRSMSSPTDLRVLPSDHPIALSPYRGQDLPRRRITRFAGAWHVPQGERTNSLVGCSMASWGSNLDWQLREITDRAGVG